MTAPNGNPLTPASLATDGIQGASARACGQCGAKHSAETAALFLALSATDAARDQLSRYACMTDAPMPGTVEAADLLDAAGVLLAQGVNP